MGGRYVLSEDPSRKRARAADEAAGKGGKNKVAETPPEAGDTLELEAAASEVHTWQRWGDVLAGIREPAAPYNPVDFRRPMGPQPASEGPRMVAGVAPFPRWHKPS